MPKLINVRTTVTIEYKIACNTHSDAVERAEERLAPMTKSDVLDHGYPYIRSGRIVSIETEET